MEKENVKTERAMYNFFTMGAENNSIPDKICAFLLAILPLLQHYIGLYKNAGFTVLLLVFPFLAYRMVRRIVEKKLPNKKCVLAILPLLLYELYVLIRAASLSRVLYAGFMLFLFACVAYECVNVRSFFRCALLIAKIASLLIILQTILFNLFGYHLRLIPTDLLLDGSEMWLNRAITGLKAEGEMYRPSGIFLEPSHLFLYVLPLLSMLILLPGFNPRRREEAILLSAGLLLSTSGLGIIVVVFLWALFWTLFQDNDAGKMNFKNFFTVRTGRIIICGILLVLICCSIVPIVDEAVGRFLPNANGYNSAIDGRTERAESFLMQESNYPEETSEEVNRIFGVGESFREINFNMAGFHATLYKFGFIGLILTYWFYGQGLFTLKAPYNVLSLIIIGVSYFSAHTHGTFYMLFYVLFLMNGHYHKQQLPVPSGDKNHEIEQVE